MGARWATGSKATSSPKLGRLEKPQFRTETAYGSREFLHTSLKNCRAMRIISEEVRCIPAFFVKMSGLFWPVLRVGKCAAERAPEVAVPAGDMHGARSHGTELQQGRRPDLRSPPLPRGRGPGVSRAARPSAGPLHSQGLLPRAVCAPSNSARP